MLSEALKVIITHPADMVFDPDSVFETKRVEHHRLVWSPYVPQEDEEEQDTCNIVVTHGNDVSC